jgi:lysyl-tRNA synthetase, class II
MRIAPELYLKRLVVGGMERVYEINRNFRNEGISTRHNPEFTMLEWYQSYATYEDLMAFTEELLSEAAKRVVGQMRFTYAGHELDFGRGWKRISMVEAIRDAVPGLSDKDMEDADRLRFELLKTPHQDAERRAIEQMSLGELVGALFEQHVEHTLTHPTFITHFPTAVSPLARRNDARPEIADRFELFVAGREIANGFSELNDPLDQKGRFLQQVEAKQRGAQETMDYDDDYIRALEHGLPATGGCGIGIDRVAMLFTGAPSIRDVILFPLLKPVGK